MANVIHGHFDSALSLHKQIVSLSQDGDGHTNDGRLILLYAGAIAECLLEYEDWKDGLNGFFDMNASFEESLDSAQWLESNAVTQSFYRDKDAELGRSVVRSYLDDHAETSFLMLRNIKSSLMAVMDDKTNFWRRLHDMTCTVLVTEQIVHNLCDQVIDINIGAEGWSLGDCVQAMGALSGQYYARSLQARTYGRSKMAVINHGFDYMVHTIMNEAMRLGMDDHAGVYTMIPANDTQPYVPFSKVDNIDVIAMPLFRIFKVADANLKSLMVAKATGRMMAVAAAGDTADMDCCVVTPLALTSMQGSYHHCLVNA
jgi:hypothetical protein